MDIYLFVGTFNLFIRKPTAIGRDGPLCARIRCIRKERKQQEKATILLRGKNPLAVFVLSFPPAGLYWPISPTLL